MTNKMKQLDWIPVKERLPDHNNNVLAVWNGYVCVMHYSHDLGLWGYVYDGLDGDPEIDEYYQPTHWMEIPSPPKQP
jgi:hypothetical protein